MLQIKALASYVTFIYQKYILGITWIWKESLGNKNTGWSQFSLEYKEIEKDLDRKNLGKYYVEISKYSSDCPDST